MIVLVYLLTLPVLIGLDICWTLVLMKDFYHDRLAYLLAPTINFLPVVAFYIVFAFGLLYLSAYPAFIKQSLVAALIAGAVLGLCAYGTYDLTNMATLPQWPLSVTIVDMLWGACIGAATSAAGYVLLGLLVSA